MCRCCVSTMSMSVCFFCCMYVTSLDESVVGGFWAGWLVHCSCPHIMKGVVRARERRKQLPSVGIATPPNSATGFPGLKPGILFGDTAHVTVLQFHRHLRAPPHTSIVYTLINHTHHHTYVCTHTYTLKHIMHTFICIV